MATNYDVLLEKMRALGMDHRWAGMFVKKLRDDENAFPVEDIEKKKWALERGFYPGRIELYGLTEENYTDSPMPTIVNRARIKRLVTDCLSPADIDNGASGRIDLFEGTTEKQ